MGKSGGSAPDTVGAARETGEQAMRLNEAQTAANRPNQYNSWGSTQWGSTPTWDPVTGQYVNQWTQIESLNPTLSQAVDSQQAVTAGRSALAEGVMGRVWNDVSNPMDFSQFGDPVQFQGPQAPGTFDYLSQNQPMQDFSYDQPINMFEGDPGNWRQQAEDSAYQRATARLDPQFQEQERQLQVRLRNQGLSPGDQAYDAAVANFNRSRNDAYEQARLASTMEGRAESNQFFGQQLQGYQANLGAQGQGFNQALASAQQNQGQGSQNFQQALSQYQAQLAGQNQQFGQGVTENQMANALRNQQIQEALMQRGFSLDELNRLLAGQGISGGPPSSGGQTDTLVGSMLSGGNS